MCGVSLCVRTFNDSTETPPQHNHSTPTKSLQLLPWPPSWCVVCTLLSNFPPSHHPHIPTCHFSSPTATTTRPPQNWYHFYQGRTGGGRQRTRRRGEQSGRTGEKYTPTTSTPLAVKTTPCFCSLTPGLPPLQLKTIGDLLFCQNNPCSCSPCHPLPALSSYRDFLTVTHKATTDVGLPLSLPSVHLRTRRRRSHPCQ